MDRIYTPPAMKFQDAGLESHWGQIFRDKLTAALDLLAKGDWKAAVNGILQALLLGPAPMN